MKYAITSIALGMMLVSNCIAGTEITGKVVSVTDGDTLTVLDSEMKQHKIRLAKIDAPEKSQAFGKNSKQALSDLVFLKQVKCDHLSSDRYQRAVAVCHLGDKNINLEMVRTGMAWVYRQYAKNSSEYYDAEEHARQSKKGLWMQNYQVPPWEYRREK